MHPWIYIYIYICSMLYIVRLQDNITILFLKSKTLQFQIPRYTLTWTVLDSYVDIGSPRIKLWGLSNI